MISASYRKLHPMGFLKRFTTWLVLLTLFSVSGLVNAKVASGPQNLTGDLHQTETAFNDLIRQAKIDFSYDAASGSPVATKRTVKPGEFSISDWSDYPADVPKPQGPFRLVEGAEYNAARKAANQANNQIRQANNLRGQPVDVHEVQPVKFGGSPTDPSNKMILDRTLHRQEVTPWWNQLQKDLGN